MDDPFFFVPGIANELQTCGGGGGGGDGILSTANLASCLLCGKIVLMVDTRGILELKGEHNLLKM
jgi:hypothetical protein